MKKGFTLIELLAVIVILAIIALIATPIVLSIISEAKDSAALRSKDFYLDAVELSLAQATLLNRHIKGATYNILVNGNICLKYDGNKCVDELVIEANGKKPSGGKITIASDGKIKDYQIMFEDKVVTNNKDNSFIAYKEGNIEVPDLYNNTLTPVTYDGDNWIVADPSKKWYDYSNQEWANAVLLRNDVIKKIGDTITVDEENPEALVMLVWIPRYEYKIEGEFGKGGTSADEPGEIEVNFISTNKLEASEGYIIHPAFNFGGTEVNGMWVGKFEISHTTLSSSTTVNNLNCLNEQCESSQGLRVLPNAQSLRYNNVSNFFYGIKSMNKEGNIFGIDKEITDTHMIKNSEWGAVAYLSQSKYGKYGNSNYIGRNKEVYTNNSGGVEADSYYTGRSGGSYGGNTATNTVYIDRTETYMYNQYGFYTYDGYLLEYDTNTKATPTIRKMDSLASTTGNIYGVYDMSGGSNEYTMGVFANSEGKLYSGNSSEYNSGFKGIIYNEKAHTEISGVEWPDEKYYNVYKASSGTIMDQTTACNAGACYGHALNETAGWYGDNQMFVSAAYPWSMRGGYFMRDIASGAFAMTYTSGHSRSYNFVSSRLIFTQATLPLNAVNKD